MLKRLYLKPDYLFAAGVLVLVWIGYQLAFKKTGEAYLLHQRLAGQLSQANDLQYQPGYLERKSRNIDMLLRQLTADSSSFRSEVIEQVAPLAEKLQCKIVDLPARPFGSEDTQIIAQPIIIEGSFAGLTKLLHALESASGIGVVRSVSWHKPDAHAGAVPARDILLTIYISAK